MKRIGILGGTFDPPHIGHLLMAEEARIKMKLDEVWWMPNRIPPHKKKDSSTTTEDRIRMVEAMTDQHPDYLLCDIELNREGLSYTADTMKEVTGKFPNHHFFFIIGADSLQTLGSWYKIDQLSSLVSFVVIQRPGYEMSELKSPVNAKIYIIEGPTIDVSSSLIREMIEVDNVNRFLLVNDVYEMIKEYHLYE
ncbi:MULTISPECIES: nicotinate-nucleotide adenylyltransferase [Bacillaceae]|uniref:Probable nicotinate-nucleotide adenylyltransferase n=1 Tax=Evansella alkalicola TaxID=745819 RepID=A0ABS6JVC2_9BACI|nr:MULTISPECIES: nicotinate-nucleotide adenylyltransferase [Bacillaceae]MBU9722533.1 nicotinate-nucleotide adenylyltransferase [Bacillus alkalicola]